MSKTPHRRSWPRNTALIVPLLLVNAAAVYGQAGWAYDNLQRGGWPWAILFACAIETVGIYLAAEAHAALMAGHSSGLLRLGSYAVGALSGALNYAHFAGPDHAPTPLAVTFGLLSSISPWLWAIRSRAMNRTRLFAAGQIDPRAVKFSRLRWTLFPLRTFSAFRLAVWDGIQSPTEAAERADARRVQLSEPEPAPVLPAPPEPAPVLEPFVPPARKALEPAPKGKPTLQLVPAPKRRRSATRARSTSVRDDVARHHQADPLRQPKDIAAEIGVSKRTVERHIASLRSEGSIS